MDGGSAQVDCSGSARWTPTTGGEARTAARSWRFDLRHNGREWVIVRAEIR
jgi:hypothetical protein